jgi:hypothetical protein
MQMAGQLFWEVRLDGSVRTDRLHLEGLPAFCGTSFAHQGTLRLRPTWRWRPRSWACPAAAFV